MKRRSFIKGLTGLLVIPVVVFSHKMRQQYYTKKTKNQSISLNNLNKIEFLDDKIIIRTNNSYSVLSNKCTHLGCRINTSFNNLLLCPCHGSKFDLAGNVIEGPAKANLKNYEFSIDKKSNSLIIR